MSESREELRSFPALPVKGSVLFPNILMPLSVGRPFSVAAVEAAVSTEEKEIVVFAQRDPLVEMPRADDLYSIGTKAIIKKMDRPREEFLELIVQGVERVVLVKRSTGGSPHVCRRDAECFSQEG